MIRLLVPVYPYIKNIAEFMDIQSWRDQVNCLKSHMKVHLKGKTWTIGFLSHSPECFPQSPWGFFCYCCLFVLLLLLLLLSFWGFCLFFLQMLRFFENIHPCGQKMSFFMKELERKEGEVTGEKSSTGFFEPSCKSRRKLHRKKQVFIYIRKKNRPF